MAKSKARQARPIQPADPDASPYAGLMAEIDEQMNIIRNDESDSGSVEKARGYLRDLMATTRFKMAISNHQIRTGIAGRLPF